DLHVTGVQTCALPILPAEERRETIRLREFAEGTAGSVMTTEVARLRATLTVREALELISRQSQDLETVYYNYVVDDDDRLLGLRVEERRVGKGRGARR